MSEMNRQQFAPAQEAAIETRGMNVLVSAGAGSGKTSVLVERVVQCLLHPVKQDITALLVVTFTDAAAAEMRERIADRLSALREEAQRDGDGDLVRHLVRQLSLLDQAQISTLHSFCMDIVRRNFFLLGLEPTFELLHPDASNILRKELLQARVESRLATDTDGSFRRMLGRFGAVDPARLFDLVLRFDTFAQSQADPTTWLRTVVNSFTTVEHSLHDSVWMPPFRSMVTRKLRRTLRLCARGLQLADGQDELQRYGDAFRTALDALRTADMASEQNPFDATVAIQTAKSALQARVTAKVHPAREIVKTLRKEAQDLLGGLDEWLSRGEPAFVEDIHLLAPDVSCLIDLIEAFSKDYEEAKRTNGKLDFSDLEHLALTALHHPHSGEALRLQEHFQEIFVDEYQDVSPIQDALINAVSRAEGNLFVVGDVKQSIYRFRMAEPGLFLHQYDVLGKDEPGRVIDLSTNYRSRPEIVEMVNFIFHQVFQQAFGGISYDDGARMEAGATYPETTGVTTEVHLIDGGGEGDNASSDDTVHTEEVDSRAAGSPLQTEAELIAKRIHELVRRGGKRTEQVWDRKRHDQRELEYRDIVILLRSAKGRVETFVDVLSRADIPVYAATSTGFYDAVEVRWLTAALRALDNPRRDIDLAALLRSPLLGLDDENLGWIRTCADGPYWTALERAAADGGTELPTATRDCARQAYETIQSWRLQARTESAESMLRKMMSDTEFLPYVLAMRGGQTRRANIERFLDDARAYDGNHYDGVFGFVHHLKRLAEEAVDVGEARSLAESENVVRVMTIHQSKGLEFPVVFVANLGKPFYQGTDEQSFPLHSEFGFGPQLFDATHHRRWHTFPWISLTEANSVAFMAEEARVLYVALTRARERLILVGTAKHLERLVTKAAGWLLAAEEPIDADGLLTAKSMLEWLVAALLRHPDASGLRALTEDESVPLYTLPATHGSLAVSLWNHESGNPIMAATRDVAKPAVLPQSLGELREWLVDLTGGEPVPDIHWRHVQSQNTVQVPGKVSATELRRLWSSHRAEKHTQTRFGTAEKLLEDPLFVQTESSARREAGVAFHTVMQHIPFSMDLSEAALRDAVDDLYDQGVLDDRARSLVDTQDMMRFLEHPLGQKLKRASVIYREQPFFTRIPVGDAFIAVQGVIDCLAKVDGDWLLIDYKTDYVTADEAPLHAQEYVAQVATYLNVARRLVGEASISAYLYFVKPQVAVPVTGVDVAEIFRS